MGRRILLFITVLLFISLKSFSAVFTVTSNADSGLGTLREALTLAAANGSATKDYIYFNLPGLSDAARTIQLATQLPDVSPNLVIDASAQPGLPFLTSDAKIKISTPVNLEACTILNGSSVNNVEVYALFLDDYSSIGILYVDLKARNAINISNGSNIIIGATGKGNLITGFYTNSIALSHINNITMQANTIGLHVDYSDFRQGAPIDIIDCNNILIGGDSQQGNVLLCATNINFPQNSVGNKLDIKSNNFGVLKDGITTAADEMFYVRINTDFINEYGTDNVNAAATVAFNFNNNIAGNFGNVFRINAVKGTVDINSNYFGIARDKSTRLNFPHVTSYEGTAISILNSNAQVNIGGNDNNKGNFFAYSFSAVGASKSTNILLRNNEYECLVYKTAYTNDNTDGSIPYITIDKTITNNLVTTLTGTSTPLATVDIYSSESCQYTQCSIRMLIKTVTADANGNWKTNLSDFGGIFYVSATLNNRTSLFKTYEVDTKNIVIADIRCGTKGTISGIEVPQGLSYHWEDENGIFVSNNLILSTDKPGKYRLVLGTGCITSDLLEIKDNRIIIYDNSITKNDASCGQQNGSIKNLFIYDPELKIDKTTWTNANNTIIGNNTDIDLLPPGAYTLKVTTTDGCTTTYGPVVIRNSNGPNIDQSHPDIQSTSCGQSTGSIKNIIVTGTGNIKYSWLNAQHEEVSTTNELTGQPAGIYVLKVTDDSQCGQIFSSEINIPEVNSITLDETKYVNNPTTCNQNNGSIKGITATGATKYQWLNKADNSTVGTKPDLTDVPPGDYQLIASNDFGCSKTSRSYHIDATPIINYPAYPSVINNSCPGQNNGSISLIPDSRVKFISWSDENGQPAGTGPTISNLKPGKYYVSFADANGCQTLILPPYIINETQPLQIRENSESLNHDYCGLKTAAISNIQITGGVLPYTYLWTDATGASLGTSKDISGIGAGTYTLQVKDAGNCALIASHSYTILNTDNIVDAPEINKLQLCSPGEAQLSVSSPQAGSNYRLYSSLTDNTFLDEQPGGIFEINANASSTFYISRISGTCESTRTKADITISLSAIDIPNVFTPNGDGNNDYWKIKGAENYPQAHIQIFTRYGQKIYESTGYSIPFDGTYNGLKLPSAVYYYIINLGKSCKLLSGNLTILR
ncbi:gliding motility-associated-like protein [Mucilaginibacter oryzae]|uniref:Gliding motility-associated-like protein n=1 Tax=Mucilaginibacter oryzae TaxID=468058 RepID=A0A316HBR5_9SPHI|nr:gliding motility-associated C-terminal domain-containing protein [Mucilaginibacter oryzae]PWK77857.1 gliding motility-associated-like protein [Mucilaginibacter oryzae]